MTKFSRPRSWVEHRLADRLEVDGLALTADLVARRGTAAPGYRVTVVYTPHDASGSGEVEAVLPPATTTAEIHQRVRDLTGDPDRLVALYREATQS